MLYEIKSVAICLYVQVMISTRVNIDCMSSPELGRHGRCGVMTANCHRHTARHLYGVLLYSRENGYKKDQFYFYDPQPPTEEHGADIFCRSRSINKLPLLLVLKCLNPQTWFIIIEAI